MKTTKALLEFAARQGINHLEGQPTRRPFPAPDAIYIPPQEEREPYAFTPEMSRRARGVEAWAALYALGKSGVAELIERSCRHARGRGSLRRSDGAHWKAGKKL